MDTKNDGRMLSKPKHKNAKEGQKSENGILNFLLHKTNFVPATKN